LIDLEFVPKGEGQAVKEAGVVDLLTEVYSTWAGGGGAKAVSVNEVFGKLQDLQAELGSGLFVIPPYFAYIAKCFSVLEGIGLSADPQYSILRDCLPYISQRLITDPSPENASALATFVYGSSDDHERRVPNPSRVEELVGGARRYTASVGSLGTAEEQAHLLLNIACADRSPLQELVLDQVASLVGAYTRSQFAALRAASGQSGDRSNLGRLLDPIGLFRASALVSTDAADEESLAAAEKLAALLQENLDASTVDVEALQRELARQGWERRQELARVSQRFAAKLLADAARRLQA
jgi:hypothetical protein